VKIITNTFLNIYIYIYYFQVLNKNNILIIYSGLYKRSVISSISVVVLGVFCLFIASKCLCLALNLYALKLIIGVSITFYII